MSRIKEFLTEWPDAEWGPAHIVLSDLNLEEQDITYCLTLLRHAISNHMMEAAATLGATAGVSGWCFVLPAVDQETRDMLRRLSYYNNHTVAELVATHRFLESLQK